MKRSSLNASWKRQDLESEDDDGGDDEERGEDTETETIDDRRHKLPLTARLLVFVSVIHLRLRLLLRYNKFSI